MSDIKIRTLVGLFPDDTIPVVVGALDNGTYEVIPVEDWDETVRKWKEGFDPGGTIGYEWREVTISVPSHELAALFQHGKISGSVSS